MPHEERRLRRQTGETDPIRLLAIHPNGSRVFSASEHCIKVFDWETRRLVMELPYESGPRDRLVVAPDGRLLAIAPNGVRGWNLETGEERSRSMALGNIHRVVSLDDGGHRVLASFGKTCTIWDLVTFEPLRELSHDGMYVRDATLSKLGDRVVSIDDHDVLYVWDAESGARISTWPRTTYCDPTLPPKAIKLDPDGRWVLSTTLVDTVLWDVERGERAWQLSGPSPMLSLFLVSPDGRTVVLSGHNDGLELWDMPTARRLMSFPTIVAHEATAALSPKGRKVSVCHDEGFSFEVISLETGARVPSRQRPTSPIERLLAHPDGRTVLTAGREEPIVTWDVTTGHPTGKLGGSPARGALDGDDVSPAERLLDAFMDQIERKHIGYRSASRSGVDDAEDYRDEARWLQSYWGAVQALEVPPGARREEVLDELEALVDEVRGHCAWMAPRDLKAMIAELRQGSDDTR
ncbi:WD-40 repeat protein [Minicystis rosea]|nr:WD-40 repeat protein [Minicystis rosea]